MPWFLWWPTGPLHWIISLSSTEMTTRTTKIRPILWQNWLNPLCRGGCCLADQRGKHISTDYGLWSSKRLFQCSSVLVGLYRHKREFRGGTMAVWALVLSLNEKGGHQENHPHQWGGCYPRPLKLLTIQRLVPTARWNLPSPEAAQLYCRCHPHTHTHIDVKHTLSRRHTHRIFCYTC